MKEETLTELIRLIEHGKEERHLEYKASGSWQQPDFQAQLIKTMLGMANIRDGGAVVIGVAQQDETFALNGMEPEHLSSYTQDNVSSVVNEYADPYVELTVTHVSHNDRRFLVLQINEFPEIPVICRRDGRKHLRRGAIYTRARRKNETVEVPSQAEMRELIDLAIDKGFRRFLSRLQSAGVLAAIAGVPTDQDRFDEQLGNL